MLSSELEKSRKHKRLSMDLTEETLLRIVEDYAYNGMEICRIVNGFNPFDFKGCNYSTEEKEWFSPKSGCRFKERGCTFNYSMIYYRLRKMQEKGLINSLKMKWIDDRSTGAIDHIPTDLFRFYFTNY